MSGVVNLKAESRLREVRAHFLGDGPVADESEAASDYEQIGTILKAEGAVADARLAFEKAIELAPDRLQYYRSLAEIQREMRLTREAMATVEHALELDPHNSECRQLLAELYLDMGVYSVAIEQADEILRTRPESLPALIAKVIAYQEMGQVDEAAASARRIVELCPHEAQHHFALGKLYQEGGRVAEAMAAFERVAAMVPDTDLSEMAEDEVRSLDAEQVQLVTLLAIEDPVFRMSLARDPEAALSERGFCISESGQSTVGKIDVHSLPVRPPHWGPGRSH